MESANIEKIIDLLSDYIREYEEKEKYNEILITQSQLYKELLSLIDKNYKILDDNKLFISVLLSAIYNDDGLTNNFYNAMHALNNGNELPYLQFVAKINFDAKEINKTISNNTRELANSKKILKTAKKSIFYLKNRRPLYDYGFIFSNIKRIINYYTTKGNLSAKEEIMLCNDLDCYNRLIISKRNEQKEYSEKIHNEIPNILNGGFHMYDDIDISVTRKQRLNKLVDEIKSFESDIPNEELIETIQSYKVHTDFDNEYNYIVNELIKYYLFQAIDYYELLLSEGTYNDKSLRKESIDLYYKALERYMILNKYYDELSAININEEDFSDEVYEENEENTQTKQLIFSHPSSNPTKARLIFDLKDMPEEYYQTVLDLIDGFLKNERYTKRLSNNGNLFQMRELKDDQVRIFLKHVKDNVFCVFGVFAKKADNDIKIYRTICNRSIPDVSTEKKLNQEVALGNVALEDLREIVSTRGRKSSR